MDIKPPHALPGFDTLTQMISDLPAQNIISIILGIILWFVGGNIVAYLSMKRRGIPFWHAMFPTPAGFKAVFGMNKLEWLIVIMLTIISLSLIAWGISNAHQ